MFITAPLDSNHEPITKICTHREERQHRTSHERYLESTQITMANKIITDHPNEMQQEKARQRKHSIDHIYEYQPVFQLHRPSCREPTQLSFVFQ